MSRSVSLLVILTLIGFQAGAAGFDEKYKAYEGDLNGDALTDIYIKRVPGTVVIPFDDIPIVIPVGVRAFVLQNDGQGSFMLLTSLSSQDHAVISQWDQADVDLHPRDVNADGVVDLELLGTASVASGAYDHVVYADVRAGRPPVGLMVKDDKYLRYHTDLMRWIVDPAYFSRGVKVVGTEPASRIWFASIASAAYPHLITQFLTECRYLNPTRWCGVSTLDPPPSQCIRSVTVFDVNGNPVGQKTIDICQHDIHIYIYIPGSVTLQVDNSIYDADARETKEILERLRANCQLPITDSDNARLRSILAPIYGSIGSDAAGSVVNTENSFPHAPFPGDELFDTNDATFHHYDVDTKICDVGQSNCNVNALTSTAGLRLFTYPSFQLRPTLTELNGELLWVFGPSGLAVIRVSSLYVIPGGKVSQRVVQQPPWAGAIQNITDATHVFYPGLISRTIANKGVEYYVFTHGIGTNRTFCSNSDTVTKAALQLLFGWSNDVFGYQIFKQLDREFVKYWKSQNP